MELPKTKKTIKEDKVKTIIKTSGIPMTEEAYKEWQKAFTDMEECFKYLDKQKNKKITIFLDILNRV